MSKNYSLNATPPNEQRIPEYVRDDDWIRSFLYQARIGRIATHWDGQPFSRPVLSGMTRNGMRLSFIPISLGVYGPT